MKSRSWWQRFLRRGSASARLLELRVRIPPEACMSACCECLFSGSSPCVGLVQRNSNECGLSEYDLETSVRKRPRLTRAI